MKKYIKRGSFLIMIIGSLSVFSMNNSYAHHLGTLYGNASGSRYCCAEGNNGCAAAPCGGVEVAQMF